MAKLKIQIGKTYRTKDGFRRVVADIEDRTESYLLGGHVIVFKDERHDLMLKLREEDFIEDLATHEVN